MTDQPDDFDPAGFQALCAQHGIKTTPVTDAFGRTDFRLDRANAEKLWALNQLAADYEARSGT